MKRVVITGLGIVSSIGNSEEEVVNSLKQGRSGVRHNPSYKSLNFRSHLHGQIDIDYKALISKKILRFMGAAAAYSYLAMGSAIKSAGLTDEQVSTPSTGLVAGSGATSNENMSEVIETLRLKGARKVSPVMVPRVMTSSISACLSVAFKIKGLNYSMSSACATSAHCIGHAYEMIQLGKQNIMFAGGGEELSETITVVFDSMGALSSDYNDTPERASRPYDMQRDGFIISGGGGIVVLEERQHALDRNAHIYGEIIGYGASSDGYDMVKPSGEGAVRCMQQALSTVDVPIDYINAHATSTMVGDVVELQAIQSVFSDKVPLINSTKSLTGHALGAAGVNELIYSLLMMKHNFISASANIDTMDKDAVGMPIVTERKDNVMLNTVMSNSFGFGGTNATLVVQQPS